MALHITASGIYNGRRRVISWAEPGVLSGDEGLRELFRSRILDLEGVYVGPPEGGGRSTDQMGWPGAFVQVARELLLGVQFSGDLDELNEAFASGDEPGID